MLLFNTATQGQCAQVPLPGEPENLYLLELPIIFLDNLGTPFLIVWP